MQHDDAPPLPRRVWFWLGGSALLGLHIIVIGIGLISSGAFDPPLAGPLHQRSTPDKLVTPAGATATRPLASALHAPFSGQLEAALLTGSAESAYGLVLAEGEHQFGVALSPAGYVRVWQTSAGLTTERLPWQTWPHIQPGSAVNTWWLNVGLEDAALVVRLNGELLWQEDSPAWCQTTAGCQLSLWANSLDVEAAITFPAWRLYTPP